MFGFILLLCYPAGIFILGAACSRHDMRLFLLGLALTLTPLAILTCIQSQAF